MEGVLKLKKLLDGELLCIGSGWAGLVVGFAKSKFRDLGPELPEIPNGLAAKAGCP